MHCLLLAAIIFRNLSVVNMKQCEYPIDGRIARSTVNEVADLFDAVNANNPIMFARDGLLLGAIRHGGGLPHEMHLDADAAVLSHDYSTLRRRPLRNHFVHVPFNWRNVRYFCKSGVPYDAHLKARPNVTGSVVLLIGALGLLCLGCLLTPAGGWRSAVAVAMGVAVIVSLVLIVRQHSTARTVIDLTIIPRDGDEYFKEVEPGERHTDYFRGKSTVRFQRALFKPLKRCRFYDRQIWGPWQPAAFLTQNYGDSVFDVMYNKHDPERRYDISACDPPPATVVT